MSEELPTGLGPEEMFYQLETRLRVGDLAVEAFPPKLAQDLALELDPITWEQRDWRLLAAVVGLTPEIIRWLEDNQSHSNKSPTLTLLDIIAGVYKHQALSHLRRYFKDMPHHFCLSLVDQHAVDIVNK